jgi:hypothetical protein
LRKDTSFQPEQSYETKQAESFGITVMPLVQLH